MGSLFRRLAGHFHLHTNGKWFLLAVVTGIMAGVGAIVFQVLGQIVVRFVLLQFAGFQPGEAAGEQHLFHPPDTSFSFLALLAVLICGGIGSGLLVYTFAPEAEGHGTDGAIDAFHNKRGNISLRVAFVKTIASAITLGTAGSGGREGPIAQIGATLGSCLGQLLKLSARDRRVLMAAGMGAGIGAIFRAPLAGALFAGEIMYRDADLESEVIVPTAIASIVAYSVYGLFLVYGLGLPPEKCFETVFGKLPEYTMKSVSELVPYGLMSIVLVLVGILYIKCFYGIHSLFHRLPGPRHIRPAIGAGLAGLVAAALYFGFGPHGGLMNQLPTKDAQVAALRSETHASEVGDATTATGADSSSTDNAADSASALQRLEQRKLLGVLSTGYGVLQTALQEPETVTIKLLLIVALFKILTTSLTISSGGSGGVFGPSMVIGGCVGVAFGTLAKSYWPELEPGAFGIVGMAGFFAGCAHAPISTIIMVSEMTGSYQLLLPTMWVSTLCFLMEQRWTLYSKQVLSRLQSPAHRGDFLVDVLEGLTVDHVYRRDRKIECVPEAMPLSEIVKLVSRTHQHYFPVLNDEERMVGIFSADDVRRFIYDETIWQLADASDVMVSRFLSVSPADDLNVALSKFTTLNIDELPVLDPKEPGRLLGMVRRKETIAAYNRLLLARKEAAAEQEV
ncbi:MAG: chloride channel protein [Planctomycetaceae bacterium]